MRVPAFQLLKIFLLVSACAAPQNTVAPAYSPQTAREAELARRADSGVSFHTELNTYRRSKGKRGMRQSPALNTVAARHAEHIGRLGRMTHKGANASTIQSRITSAMRACSGAENLANGHDNTSWLLKDWARSPVHRDNLLAPKATHYGLGRSGKMWVMVVAEAC